MDVLDYEYSDEHMKLYIDSDDLYMSDYDDLSSHHDDYLLDIYSTINNDNTTINTEMDNNINKLKTIIKKSKNNSKENERVEKRKTLYYGKNAVKASGVMFYKRKRVKKNSKNDNKYNSGIEVLVLFTKGKYEDPGGKIDEIDESIEAAAAREVSEETNNVITQDMALSMINHKSTKCHYSKISKYLLYLVEANNEIKNINMDDFGTREIKYDYKRIFQWIDIDKLYSQTNINGRRINPRIISLAVPKQIKKIMEKKKKKKSYF